MMLRRLLSPAAVPGRRPLFVLAAAVSVCAALAGFAAPAQAQSGSVLVSNAGQTLTDSFHGISGRVAAQGFRTGANAAGYTLSGVDVHFVRAPVGDQSVSVYRANAVGNPSTELYALTAPSDVGVGFNTYGAPANATLDADSHYFVRFAGNSGTRLGLTASDDEDAGGETDWSIDNTFIGGFGSDALPIRIRGARAAANAAPAFDTAAAQTVDEGVTLVAMLEATDSDATDAVTGFALTGGADQSAFTVGSTEVPGTGTQWTLSFATAPDFEQPTDVGDANVYEVEVTATSGTGDRALSTAADDVGHRGGRRGAAGEAASGAGHCRGGRGRAGGDVDGAGQRRPADHGL